MLQGLLAPLPLVWLVELPMELLAGLLHGLPMEPLSESLSYSSISSAGRAAARGMVGRPGLSFWLRLPARVG